MWLASHMNISRSAAQEIIKSGHVEVNGKAFLKPGIVLPKAADININSKGRKFVGRGGDKLDAALSAFEIDVKGRICLDVGASTGGFTDCLLKRGAAKVYAIENGKDQLAASLLANPQVVSMEETDIRNAVKEWFDEPISFAAVDVSFISLTKVLEPMKKILAEGAELVCLIKPQFEVGKAQLSKRGIVRNPKARLSAVEEVNRFSQALGFKYISLVSTTLGLEKNKNQEFLVHYKN